MIKLALITGITGQDGAYLKELLLEKGYIIYGVVRMNSKLDHLISDDKIHLRYGDLTDTLTIKNIFNEIEETYDEKDIERFEVYNLAALSQVRVSFEMPEYAADVDGLGVLRILDCIRISKFKNKVRFYQASTSELFGKAQEVPQTEKTPFYPRSPYGVSKLFGYWITKNYRESYNMFACNGILFNHESSLRGPTFVTRKITLGLSNILKNKINKLYMGNLDAKRDWGHARDYVYGMWLMLQQDKPDDYVLSTGETHSIKEFIEKAFALKGFNIKWKGEGVNEIGYDENSNRELIAIDPHFFRPAEVDLLIGDCSKAKKELGWEHQITFDELIKEMVENDCE